MPGAHFNSDLGADSLDMVEFVMEFEKEFNISVPDDDTDNIKTVVDAFKYIIKSLQEKQQ